MCEENGFEADPVYEVYCPVLYAMASWCGLALVVALAGPMGE
jgi:hypothetical protein